MSESIPQLIPLIGVAKSLCVSTHTVRAWVRSGQLQPIRICRRLLFHPTEIDRFLSKIQGNKLVIK
jgi:excisionase family DNA binding protein